MIQFIIIDMNNLKIYITLLLLLSLPTVACTQKVANGYYNNINNDTYIYVYNDTIVLSFYSGTMGVTILKGVIDNIKGRINFIPIDDKMESRFSIVEKKRNDSVSILRFNLYDYFTGKLSSAWYDGSSLVNETLLGCLLVYTTHQNKVVKESRRLIFNGKYFEISLPSDLFINAELTIFGHSKSVTVPIFKNTLLFVDIVQAPLVYYDDKHKRMKYKYSDDAQRIEILFNMTHNNSWNTFKKVEKPHENRFQKSIEEHW